jgi:hypothetical protein
VNQAGVRISGCVFLERTGAPRDTLLSPITPAHAVFALLPYLNLAAHLEPGAVIARVAPLASAVSMVDLARGPVAVMADTVERWLGEQS